MNNCRSALSTDGARSGRSGRSALRPLETPSQQAEVPVVGKIESADLIGGDPAQLVVLVGGTILNIFLAVDEPDHHLGATTCEVLRVHRRANRSLENHADFFEQFALQGLRRRLVGFDVTSRQSPRVRVVSSIRTPVTQKDLVASPQYCHDDQLVIVAGREHEGGP